ncbi:MAG: PAS domain-containing sensor histidine kinase [Bacteroidales bacterium]|nr:PAS domain-containing sensor histidine kinase [Bacteroidales bacterium]
MNQIQEILNQYPWYYYAIGGLSLLIIILIFRVQYLRRKARNLKKQDIANQIDLEESGKTEMWFKVFSAAAPQVFWIRNKIKTLYVSPFFESLIGHPARIAKGGFPYFDEIAHPDDLERIKQNYHQFTNTNDAQLDHIFRIAKPSGKYIWIRERVMKHQYVSGDWFLVGLLEDETEKQQSIEELKNHQLLVNNILSSTDEGIYVLNLEYKPIYWNKAMESFSGFNSSEIIDGKIIWEHLPHLVENGISKIIEQTMLGKRIQPDVFPYQLSNQRKGHTREKYLPLLNTKNEIIGVIGFVKDITEELAMETILEKTQERYALTMQAVNDGIWDWNLNNNTIIYSDSWFSMLGYSPDELSSSLKTFVQLADNEASITLNSESKKAFRHHQPIDIELRMRHKEGHWIWVMIRGRCIEHDDKDVPLRAIGTQTDITIRKNYEIDLLRAKEKAEESDQLKSSFLANISHEIRTPLNAIVGFSDLVINEDSDKKEKEGYKQQIQKNSDKLLQLINDIVELSKLESRQHQMKSESIDLVELLTSTAREVIKGVPSEQSQNLELTIKIPSESKGIKIVSDPQLLKQIITQLLNNAYKFTEKGNIDLGCLPQENGSITLFVKDTGVGIDPADSERIFNRFVQVDHGLTRKYGGTGLGLTLAKIMAETLGGNIWVESTPGEGSTFYVKLKVDN